MMDADKIGWIRNWVLNQLTRRDELFAVSQFGAGDRDYCFIQTVEDLDYLLANYRAELSSVLNRLVLLQLSFHPRNSS